MWNNAPHHHTKKIVFYFFTFLRDHGIMNCIFFMACHGIYIYNPPILSTKRFWCLHHDVTCYTFVNYICTKYVNAHVHQGLNPRPHGSLPKS